MAKGSGSKGGAHGVGGAAGRAARAVGIAALAVGGALAANAVLNVAGKEVSRRIAIGAARRAARETANRAATRASQTVMREAIGRRSLPKPRVERAVSDMQRGRRAKRTSREFFRERLAPGATALGARTKKRQKKR